MSKARLSKTVPAFLHVFFLNEVQSSLPIREAAANPLYLPSYSLLFMVDFEIDTPACWRVLFTWFTVVMGFLFTMEMIHVAISLIGCSVQFCWTTCCLFTVKFPNANTTP